MNDAELADRHDKAMAGVYRELKDARETISKLQDELNKKKEGFIDIVFDGSPGPEGPRFVEMEDENGHGTNVGTWKLREDGYWVIRIERGSL